MRILLFLALAGALCAQTPPSAAPATGSNLRFSMETLDRTADPCVDFYQFACGNWVKNNPIPPDQARWGRFDALAERNRDVLHNILDQASQITPERDAVTQKIGDYYAACMDEKAIDAKGLAPLQAELDRIRNLKDKSELAAEVAHLHRNGMPALFEFGSGQDFKDSSAVIAQLDQGGLGLPDRDYYLKTDAKSEELRQKYVAHVQRMFELAGEKLEQAKVDAAAVMRIETDLAKSSLDLVSRRDPEKVYHKMTSLRVAALVSNFNWESYVAGSGAPKFDVISVTSPDYFTALNAEIQSVPLADWKTYLTWHALHSEAPLLPTAFVNENFDFYGKTLTGAKEMRPRWKRCVDFTDGQLGEALGRKFVERTFGAEGKERTLKMVDALEKALGQDLQALTWMTPATKQKAMEKLKAITNKIGYPDKWRDYSAVTVKPNDFLGDVDRATAFESRRQLDKIGRPVDRTEWGMPPPTVNAYFDPQMNDINFPAGVLQPPLYDPKMDDAPNYGNTGATIGHELTHGFDDEGRQFDAKGNLKDWWTKQDADEFNKRTACVVDQYAQYTVVDDIKINSKLTLGEDVADLGGTLLAYMAWKSATEGKQLQPVDGFTPEQRFFIGMAQWACGDQRPEDKRMNAITNPHSPDEYRINGVVSNMPEFSKAFSCKAAQPMARANACRVW